MNLNSHCSLFSEFSLDLASMLYGFLLLLLMFHLGLLWVGQWLPSLEPMIPEETPPAVPIHFGSLTQIHWYTPLLSQDVGWFQVESDMKVIQCFNKGQCSTDCVVRPSHVLVHILFSFSHNLLSRERQILNFLFLCSICTSYLCLHAVAYHSG